MNTPAIPDSAGEAALHTLKQKLVLGYRILGLHGLGLGLLAHLTARLPGGDTFWSYPFGASVEEVTLESLCEARFDGATIDTARRVNPTLSAHGAVYSAHPELVCIVHHHGDNAVAAGAIGMNLEPFDNNAARWHGDVRLVADYEDSFSIAEQGSIMARAFSGAHGLILKHHGLIVAHTSIEEAVVRVIELEHSLGVQLKAQAAGKLNLMPPGAIDECKKFLNSPAYFLGMWDYFCRRLRREGLVEDLGF
jgi:L-fuculose-phosphate aldolase